MQEESSEKRRQLLANEKLAISKLLRNVKLPVRLQVGASLFWFDAQADNVSEDQLGRFEEMWKNGQINDFLYKPGFKSISDEILERAAKMARTIKEPIKLNGVWIDMQGQQIYDEENIDYFNRNFSTSPVDSPSSDDLV